METDIVGEQGVDTETPEAAAEAIARSVSLLHAAAVPGSGHLLRVAGDHGPAAARSPTSPAAGKPSWS